MRAMEAAEEAAKETAANTTANTTAERELVPHRPEYSDVGFLSEAEMSERRQRRCGQPSCCTVPERVVVWHRLTECANLRWCIQN